MFESDNVTTFLIHHLSDIHIGPSHYSASNRLAFVRDHPQPRNLKLYQDFLKYLPPEDLPDITICSGDFTSYATEQEMYTAEDNLRAIVAELKRKRPCWRQRQQAPYAFIVPGNHDLDWTRDTYDMRIHRYARMSYNLSANNEVLSSHYIDSPPTPPVCFDFGDDVNVFVYLFDTTSLGGVDDPQLTDIRQRLQSIQRQILNPKSEEEHAQILAQLERQSRRDPGYVSPRDLDRMMHFLATGGVPDRRIKIAVMHHNPSSVPSDDLETFDSITNAGFLKSKLVQAQFDLVLHGHRHVACCTHERSVHRRTDWPQGIFIIGADSLGCKQNAPFFELRLWDTTRAHDTYPPATLFELRLTEHNGEKYAPMTTPFAEDALHRPMYAAIGEVLRRLGRQVDQVRREKLDQYVRNLIPALQDLQSSLAGWSDDRSIDWISSFHNLLGRYSKIYATDSSQRRSTLTPEFDSYLREQYRARLIRLQRGTDRRLCFSSPVYCTIKRTGWQPDQTLWSDYTVAKASSESDLRLEIVRIVVRDKNMRGLREELERLDFEHKLFAIPLFVLEPSDLGKSEVVDFVLACDRGGDLMRCYEFHDAEARVEEVNLERGYQLKRVFLDLLGNDRLKTVDHFLDYRPMIRDVGRLTAFAELYDSHRKASPMLVELLKKMFSGVSRRRGLEIGCGTGNYTKPFEDDFDEVLGLDVNEEMLQAARRKSEKIRWIHSNALNSRLPSNHFNAIWLISTLHYFTGVLLERIFEEVYRMLVPGGVLVADTEFAEQHKSLWLVEFFPSLRSRYRNACLPVAEFKRRLGLAGFQNVKVDTLIYDSSQGDAMLRIGQHEPSLYLDREIREVIPAFREMGIEELEQGVDRLHRAIDDESIREVVKKYEDQAELPGDIGVITATR